MTSRIVIFLNLTDFMTRKFYLEQETGAARRLQTRSGFEFWVPRSVCKRMLKFPPNQAGRVVVEVEVEDWWWRRIGWNRRWMSIGRRTFFE